MAVRSDVDVLQALIDAHPEGGDFIAMRRSDGELTCARAPQTSQNQGPVRTDSDVLLPPVLKQDASAC